MVLGFWSFGVLGCEVWGLFGVSGSGVQAGFRFFSLLAPVPTALRLRQTPALEVRALGFRIWVWGFGFGAWGSAKP